MGDAGPQANRVLHLAFKGDELVGCASSTFSPGWTPDGCGHWGLLAVDPAHQNSGVATALVIAAERRLATISAAIQIEYQYTEGDSFSQRPWYVLVQVVYIVLYHVVSCCIVLYHVVSCCIMLYHVVSCCIMFTSCQVDELTNRSRAFWIFQAAQMV